MKRLAFLLLIIALSACDKIPGKVSFSKSASSNEIVAGDKSTSIVDYYAKLDPESSLFKKIEVVFFTVKLTDEQKQKLATKQFADDAFIKKVTGGNLPVLRLWLLFDQKEQVCSEDTIQSFTAIFEKNASFNFDAKSDAPINFAFSKSSFDKLNSIGFEGFKCSFENAEKITFKQKNQFEADSTMFGSMLPDGVSKMNFSWNLDVDTKLYDPLKILKPLPAVSITNDNINGIKVYWRPEDKVLTLAYLKNPEKPGVKSDYHKNLLAEMRVVYNEIPENFETAKPKYVTISLDMPGEGNSINILDYTIHAETVSISGKAAPGSDIKILATGTMQGDVYEQKPGINYNINLVSKIP